MAQATVKLPQSELELALAARPKHVLITGASRGIGEAVARLLGEEPAWRFTLAARSYTKSLAIAMDLGTDRAQAVKLDLMDERSIDDCVVAAESKFGPVDFVICNAGINLPTPVDDLSANTRQAFRDVLTTNVMGTYFLAQLASAHMPHGGRIVFIGSVLARFGAPGTSAYTASKHALLGITRSMAQELAPRGIRVNCVNPGWVDTQMAHESLSRMAEAQGVSLQQMTAQALSVLPIRRMIKPIEVAQYIKFLVGPGGDAVTGQGIDISCGSVMV
jgi:NAD(P)-dependent dehydrogenase (short-subunit alcohol dehydrogenase family)